MKKVKRFDLYHTFMEQKHNGTFVLYSDYEELEKENKKLKDNCNLNVKEFMEKCENITKEICKSKKSAIEFLYEAGLCTKRGKLKEMYLP